uniref:Uncharacterized protein n=1 Tax=Arundo donax TaxID=35708 RepID=A0A0A8YR27_ARUDO
MYLLFIYTVIIWPTKTSSVVLWASVAS